jgi:inorganic phosphate transporter, PiT family
VAIGAGLTVLLATLTGFPISTTHSLIGGLIGAGLTAVGDQVNFGALASGFLAPLLFSPLMVVVLSAVAYLIFSKAIDYRWALLKKTACASMSRKRL